jgi:hypothetical protein
MEYNEEGVTQAKRGSVLFIELTDSLATIIRDLHFTQSEGTNLLDVLVSIPINFENIR